MKKWIKFTTIIPVLILYIVSLFNNLTPMLSLGSQKSDLAGFILSISFLIAYVLFIALVNNKMAYYVALAISSYSLILVVWITLIYLFKINITGDILFLLLIIICTTPFYGLTFMLPSANNDSISSANIDCFLFSFSIIALLLFALKIIMFVRLKRITSNTVDSF